MDRDRNERSLQQLHETTSISPGWATALFGERQQAEIAVRDLERNQFPRNTIGIVIPETSSDAPGFTGDSGQSRRRAEPRGPPLAFAGWTAGMAPWHVAGVGPLMVLGSLSLTRPLQRPKDLREFGSALGLGEEALPRLREGFQRHEVLVSVEAPDKAPAAAHVLERNGGQLLPLQTG